MKSPTRQGPEFVKSYKNRNNARRRKEVSINNNIMNDIFSKHETEFLGEFLDCYTRKGHPFIKTVKINIAYIPTKNERNFLLTKLNSLLDIMEFNIRFVENAIKNRTLPEAQKELLNKDSIIHGLAKTSQISYAQTTTISKLSYDRFLETIKSHLSYSTSYNPSLNIDSEVNITNSKLISSLLALIASEKLITEEEFLKVADRLKIILRKNIVLSRIIVDNPNCLLKPYIRCHYTSAPYSPDKKTYIKKNIEHSL